MEQVLKSIYQKDLSLEKVAILSREAEKNFVGVQCGIMDQFSVVMGHSNQLILLDCHNLKHTMIEADFQPWELLLLNLDNF